MDTLSRFDSVGCDEPENISKFIIPHTTNKMLNRKTEKSIKLTSTKHFIEIEKIVYKCWFRFLVYMKNKLIEKVYDNEVEINKNHRDILGIFYKKKK